MAILKQARLVDSRKQGRWMFYRLAEADAPAEAAETAALVARLLADDPQVQRRRQAAEANPQARPRGIVQETQPMLKILFLCTGNSCRSQMAEGWARHAKGGQIEPYSAGIEAHGLNPDAVRVMAEAGVDISGQRRNAWTNFATSSSTTS